MTISLIITAGGTSTRYGKTNKLLEKINGKTVIEYCVEKFLPINEIFEIIISSNSEIIEILKDLFKNNKKIKIIEGGKTRQESVFNALKSVQNPDYVLIHDGARPLVKTDDIKKLIEKMKVKNAVILAVKTIDTIKKVDEIGKIITTLDRTNLYNVQTPQGFRFDLIYNAHKNFDGQNFTDDAGMLEAMGNEVYVVDGDYSNFKITTKFDFELAEKLLNSERNNKK